MRLVSSSDPGAVDRDRHLRLLTNRVVLTTAVCRELLNADNFAARRPRAALDLLRGWVGERYDKDVETHPSDGIDVMVIPDGAEVIERELRAGAAVCEALAMLCTADNAREMADDESSITARLAEFIETVGESFDDGGSGQEITAEPPPPWFRLPGLGGAAVTLRSVVVPERHESGHGTRLALDVGLISPDRSVQYLARPSGDGFINSVAQFLFRAANDFHPEKSLATFTDEPSGLTIAAVASSETHVEIEVTVVEQPGDDVLEHDVLIFEVSRTVLTIAAHDIRRLDGSADPVLLSEVP